MVQGPEFVAGVARVFRHNAESGGGAKGALRHDGIRQQAEYAQLRQRVGCPRLMARPRKPGMGRGMSLVPRPNEGKQHVHVQQVPIHSSSNNSRTCSVVMVGNSAGTSTTVIPLTIRVRSWYRVPRRISSDAALPSETPRRFAYV